MFLWTTRTAFQAFVILITSSNVLVWSRSPSNDSLSPWSTSSIDLPPIATPATATPYAILAKPGASLARVYSSIAYLTVRIVHEGTSFQGYCANLTEAQVGRLSRHSAVEWVLSTTHGDCLTTLNGHPPISFHRRSSPGSGGGSPRPEDQLEHRPNSAMQLRLLSDPGVIGSEGDLTDYFFDANLGVDQDIYIIDDGFNVNNEQLVGRVVDTHVVPNNVILRYQPKDFWPPHENTIAEILIPSDDGVVPGGHGTMVASVAVGNTLGVASAANLFLIKDTTIYNDVHGQPDGHWGVVPLSEDVIDDYWKYIKEKVAERRQHPGSENRQSIISMSTVYKNLPVPRHHLSSKFQAFFDWAFSEDIVVVVCTGNAGYTQNSHGEVVGSTTRLKDLTPPNLGTEENALITVGGVDRFGNLDYQTTPSDGTAGSITVYSLSDSATVARPAHNDGNITLRGTSFASPAVAGLAAYFFSLDSLRHQWHKGSIAKQMKEYIRAWSRVHTEEPFPDQGMPQGYPLPPKDSIKVAYNGAESGLDNYHDASTDDHSTDSGDPMDLDCEEQEQ